MFTCTGAEQGDEDHRRNILDGEPSRSDKEGLLRPGSTSHDQAHAFPPVQERF